MIVVSGGIGGLASAYALAREGRSVRVLERAPEFGEVGAGLQIAPNATRVPAERGLLDKVIAAGVEPKRVVLRDAVSGQELSHLDVGEEFRKRYGTSYVVTHSSDLNHTLDACAEAGVELQTGTQVSHGESADDKALTHCADGSAYESSAMLGMDGLMSTLRQSIVGDEPVASGYVAYRGAVPLQSMPVDVGDVVAWTGPRCHLVQYPLRRGKRMNQVAVFSSPAFERGESERGAPEEFDAAFEHCCEHVRTSLTSLRRDRQWQMYDREPASNWIDGVLALLGDAAHPMLQYLAQGANQAIEDAHVLAAESAKHTREGQIDRPTILKATQDIRIPRIAEAQRTARTWGEIRHVDGLARSLRDELLPDREIQHSNHVDWLYGI